MKELIIGNEYNTNLINKLKTILRELGGKIKIRMDGIAGSQDLQIFDVLINKSKITVEIETYMGIKIAGDDLIINEIERRIKS